MGSGNKSIKRILVVDDEYDISLTIKVVLEENGFMVDSFNDASQALENFMTGIYDLVILDVKMPEMDGFTLYEKIKKSDDKVAICFLTATDDAYYERLKKNYPRINEDCIIHKPVDNESPTKTNKISIVNGSLIQQARLTYSLVDLPRRVSKNEYNKPWQKLCVY